MAHVGKYTRTQTGQLFAHYERKQNENGEHRKYKNQDIDLSKTHLNYNLCPNTKTKSQIDFYHERLSEVYVYNRSDVKTMCDWVITLPQKISVDSDEEKRFFKKTYEFFSKRYEEENVISAYVHKDETQPHMHFSFIPITYDEKKKRYKVSAKDVLTKKELQSIHPDFSEFMKRSFNRDMGVLNGATELGNKSVEELKKLSLLENKIKSREEYLQEISKVKKVDSKPTLFDKDKVVVNKKEFEDLKRIAATSERSLNYFNQAKSVLLERDEILEKAKTKANNLIRDAEKQAKEKLQIENEKFNMYRYIEETVPEAFETPEFTRGVAEYREFEDIVAQNERDWKNRDRKRSYADLFQQAENKLAEERAVEEKIVKEKKPKKQKSSRDYGPEL